MADQYKFLLVRVVEKALASDYPEIIHPDFGTWTVTEEPGIVGTKITIRCNSTEKKITCLGGITTVGFVEMLPSEGWQVKGDSP